MSKQANNILVKQFKVSPHPQQLSTQPASAVLTTDVPLAVIAAVLLTGPTEQSVG